MAGIEEVFGRAVPTIVQRASGQPDAVVGEWVLVADVVRGDGESTCFVVHHKDTPPSEALELMVRAARDMGMM